LSSIKAYYDKYNIVYNNSISRICKNRRGKSDNKQFRYSKDMCKKIDIFQIWNAKKIVVFNDLEILEFNSISLAAKYFNVKHFSKYLKIGHYKNYHVQYKSI